MLIGARDRRGRGELLLPFFQLLELVPSWEVDLGNGHLPFPSAPEFCVKASGDDSPCLLFKQPKALSWPYRFPRDSDPRPRYLQFEKQVY